MEIPTDHLPTLAFAVGDLTEVGENAHPQDLAVAAGFHRTCRRRQSVAARALARCLLTRLTGKPGARWVLERDSDGRYWAASGGSPRLSMSLSHSRGRVAAAVAKIGPIGIDIEWIDPSRRFRDIAERAFGPEECHLIAREGAAAFYRIWTFREALAKATGRGFELLVDGADRYGVAAPLCHEATLEGYALAVVGQGIRPIRLEQTRVATAIHWIGFGTPGTHSGPC